MTILYTMPSNYIHRRGGPGIGQRILTHAGTFDWREFRSGTEPPLCMGLSAFTQLLNHTMVYVERMRQSIISGSYRTQRRFSRRIQTSNSSPRSFRLLEGHNSNASLGESRKGKWPHPGSPPHFDGMSPKYSSGFVTPMPLILLLMLIATLDKQQYQESYRRLGKVLCYWLFHVTSSVAISDANSHNLICSKRVRFWGPSIRIQMSWLHNQRHRFY